MTQVERLTVFEVQPKRSFEKQPIQFDYHDHLSNQWERGRSFQTGAAIRPIRALATGLEYEATTGGVTGRKRPNFPATSGLTVQDGSVTWTARRISTDSLRATIASSSFPTVTGLTLSDHSDEDLVYTVFAAAGTSGQSYDVAHRVTLSNAPGEIKESVAVLPVID